MIVILPMSLTAQEASAAMLRSDGAGVLVNKNSPQPSTALFSGDLIETQPKAAARIEASGSTAHIGPETMVQFTGDELVLEHGRLSVSTTRGMKVRAGCVTLTPANIAEWTHYDVSDLDGKVIVLAVKNDVNINAKSSLLTQAKQSGQTIRVTVHEGEQTSRDEKCGAPDDQHPVPSPAPLLNSPWTLGAGAVGIGLLTCLLALCRSSAPMSPKDP